jgi:hypothetical protein
MEVISVRGGRRVDGGSVQLMGGSRGLVGGEGLTDIHARAATERWVPICAIGARFRGVRFCLTAVAVSHLCQGLDGHCGASCSLRWRRCPAPHACDCAVAGCERDSQLAGEIRFDILRTSWKEGKKVIVILESLG